jgi:hypothetical protein
MSFVPQSLTHATWPVIVIAAKAGIAVPIGFAPARG